MNRQTDMNHISQQELVQCLYEYCNGPAGMLKRELVKQFDEWHPAIQQAFFDNVIEPVLKVMATTRGDARNARAIKLAKFALDKD